MQKVLTKDQSAAAARLDGHFFSSPADKVGGSTCFNRHIVKVELNSYPGAVPVGSGVLPIAVGSKVVSGFVDEEPASLVEAL